MEEAPVQTVPTQDAQKRALDVWRTVLGIAGFLLFFIAAYSAFNGRFDKGAFFLLACFGAWEAYDRTWRRD